MSFSSRDVGRLRSRWAAGPVPGASLIPERTERIAIGRRRAIATVLAFGGAFALATLVTRSARAVTDNAADDAHRFVRIFTDEAMAAMADRAAADELRMLRFRDVFVASFDLPAIGQVALGRHWQEASVDQQEQFLQLFERQQVLIFAGRFRYISRQKLTVQPFATDAGGAWRVPSRIDRAYARPIQVDWTVTPASGAWRVFDLAIDDMNMSSILRADFAAVLQSNEGRFDALLGAMQKKIDELGVG